TIDLPVLEAMGAFLHAMNLDRPHRHLVTAALYHQGPIGYASLALTAGGSVVIMRKFEPEEALRLIDAHHCTSTFMPPVLAKRVVDLPAEVRERYDTTSLEVFVVTAGPVPQKLKEDILDLFGPVYYEAYSSTETALSATALTPADVRGHPGSCGRTVAGVGFTIRDDNGNELPRGERGLICCPNLRGSFAGYHKDPELSRDVFRDEWLTVGDIGYMDDEGFLYIVDRVRDMIISGGTNIYSAEIENVLHEHPAIRDVAIIGVADDDWGERVHACVQLKPGASLTLDELQAFARQRLAGYKVPRGLSVHSEFPRDAAGKLAKKSLREQFAGPSQPTKGTTVAKTKSEVVSDMLLRQYNDGDITAVDDAIAENHIDHNPTHNQEQGRAGVRKLIQGMIDRGGYTCEIHASFESGELVCTRYTIHAEHSSDMLGLPAAGKKTSTHVVEVDRVVDGMIVESWGESAQFDMLKQLGLVSDDFPYDLIAAKAAEGAGRS
ncbi:MAG TPA: AMP-binding protein, partial [Ilumatobacteraceae bacterium]